MTQNAIEVFNSGAITNPRGVFEAIAERIAPHDPNVPGMISAASRRVYWNTFNEWLAYADEAGFNPLDVNDQNVAAFLSENVRSKATQKRRLSALRRMAELLVILSGYDESRRMAYDGLKLLIKPGSLPSDESQERQRLALTPADADRLLRVARQRTERHDDGRAKAIRDYAIVATLLLSGLRRAELAALKWQDVDLDAGVISVRHGKGDKAREAAIYSHTAIDALKAWREVQPGGFQHVFVRVLKGGNFDKDEPLNTLSIWRVVKSVAAEAGLPGLKPHDLRRTLATELLVTGTPVHDVQAQLGHADSSTTLDNYAVAADARERRRSGKVRYG